MSWISVSPIVLDKALTPSLLGDNLKASGPALAFASGTEAVIVDLHSGKPSTISPSVEAKVHSVALEVIAGELTAVVVSGCGAEFWRLGDTPARPRLVSIQSADKPGGGGGDYSAPYFRGCASLGSGSSEVVVGCSTGDVLVLDLSLSGSSSASKVKRRLTGHAAPVSALAVSADKGLVASADDDGEVRVWDPRRDFGAVCTFAPPAPPVVGGSLDLDGGDALTPCPPPGYPCSSLGFRGDILVAAFAHGVMR
jgi:WD40 repeat protein